MVKFQRGDAAVIAAQPATAPHFLDEKCLQPSTMLSDPVASALTPVIPTPLEGEFSLPVMNTDPRYREDPGLAAVTRHGNAMATLRSQPVPFQPIPHRSCAHMELTGDLGDRHPRLYQCIQTLALDPAPGCVLLAVRGRQPVLRHRIGHRRRVLAESLCALLDAQTLCPGRILP